MALLKEIPYFEGKAEVNGEIAYVEQEPIIFNGILKNLITFGNEMNEEKFENILHSTGLKEDLKLLNDGKNTEIGERGVNLSGG